MQSLGTSAKLVLLLLFDALVPIAGLLHRVMAPGREQVKCLMSIHWASDSSNWYSDIQIDRYTDNIWYTDITDTYECIYIHIIVNIYIYIHIRFKPVERTPRFPSTLSPGFLQSRVRHSNGKTWLLLPKKARTKSMRLQRSPSESVYACNQGMYVRQRVVIHYVFCMFIDVLFVLVYFIL